MILLPNRVGSKLSHLMTANSDDDQPYNSRREDSCDDDPTILWAVDFSDGRKAALVEGAQLFVGRNAMDLRTFNGPSEIAKKLSSLGIDNFAEVKRCLPVNILEAIADLEEAEKALRHPPQQTHLFMDRQVPLFSFPRAA